MRTFVCLGALVALIGCGGSDTPSADAGMCNPMVTGYPLLAATHVTECSDITWNSNPPTSGSHYPIWPAYTTYDQPVPHGYLVHALEHGGVVIGYNCSDDCSADVARLQAFLDARPADPSCAPPVHARIIVAPDPDLDVRFAAASWGFALTADCFDLGALGSFIDAHYAMAPEDTCADGVASPTCP